MSYLLTEIALEMLGYKFYDIYGVPGETNFQFFRNPETNEPHLQEFLKSTDTSDQDDNTVTQLIEKEMANIRVELVKSKNSFRANELYKLEYANTSEKELMEKHISEQRQLLKKAAEDMQEFRNHVEQRIETCANPVYENYVQTFKTLSAEADS